MGGKWFRWLLAIILVGQLIRIMIGAFSVPWSWRLNQLVLAFCALCLPIGLVVWGRVWKRGGMEAVRGRWRETWRIMDTPSRNKTSFRRWFWFWVVVLLAIVVFQTFTQHPHG
jgi:hypothetical protein